MAAAKALAVLLAVGELFYGSPVFAIFLFPYIPFSLYREKKRLQKDMMWRLNTQFGEAIRAVSASLESGYSVENAISEAYKDLSMTLGTQEPVMRELTAMKAALKNNVPIEELFISWAERSGLEDIESFSTVFTTAKRSGGSLIAAIRATGSMIRSRVEMKREVRLAAADKQYEMKIMRMMPFVIVLYLRIFSPDMISEIYEGLFGRVFATVILLIYIAGCLWADHILNLEL